MPNLISETNYDGNNKAIKVSRHSYKYDQHNNWIKKISEEYYDELEFPDIYQIFLRDINTMKQNQDKKNPRPPSRIFSTHNSSDQSESKLITPFSC